LDIIGILSVIGLILWIVLSLTILVGIFSFVPTLRRLDNLVARLDEAVKESEGRLGPVMEHLGRSADNLDYVTTALRSDVEQMGETVERAADSAHRLLTLAEERASEINGFLEVVQEEAEETFLSTASVLRALRGSRRRSGEQKGRRSA